MRKAYLFEPRILQAFKIVRRLAKGIDGGRNGTIWASVIGGRR
jgi:hypothetical protein